MSVPVVVRLAAAVDIRDAAAWYELKRTGWGDRFDEEVVSALSRIEDKPELFGRVYKDVRRAPVNRFPYGIFYRLIDDAAIVIAVMHGRRNLLRLKNRLD
jgi:plasmid stabilization system protein ParE